MSPEHEYIIGHRFGNDVELNPCYFIFFGKQRVFWLGMSPGAEKLELF